CSDLTNQLPFQYSVNARRPYASNAYFHPAWQNPLDFAAMANRFVTDVPECFGFFGPGFSQHHITPFMDKPE
ncbi:hypothetical protein, partial [Enterobacter sp.]